MSNKNQITRSTVNEQQYSAPEFQKSGFPHSYRRYDSAILGRIHAKGFHWTMPGDKISGKTTGEFTFHRIVTPIVSPINAMQYNVFLPLRPLDRSFKKGMSPTKLNAMSANWTMPLFNTRYLVDQILRAYFNLAYNDTITVPATGDISNGIEFIPLMIYQLQQKNPKTYTLANFVTDLVTNGYTMPDQYGVSQTMTLDLMLYDSVRGMVDAPVNNLVGNGTILAGMADALYLRDALLDIADFINAKLNGLSGTLLVSEFINLYLSTLLTPFVGRYSYYAEFKYEFLRPADFLRIGINNCNSMNSDTWADFLTIFSDTPQNEYAIRAMYAIWYELFRNVDLEPVSTTLPDWQEWSSTSIFDMSAGGNLLYLIYRIRPWEDDMFISAQIDDLSRHVYAPIINQASSATSYHSQDINNSDAQVANSEFYGDPDRGGHIKPATYTLGYHDQMDDTDKQVVCPVPTNINDILSSLDLAAADVYGLDLNTLRQSQMLERYLKRNYLFGDEYQDRMLAHYQSRVSDMRINKPEILSRSMDGYDQKQEVSNVSTDETKVGDRTATAKVNINGEQYTTFCEEFGIVVSIVCFMPRSMYDGTCPQNYLSKQVHMPLPEFAANNEEFGRKSEIAGSGLSTGYLGDEQDSRFMFGRYPAYHAWRSRVDEVGGEFLDELQECTFRRFFGMFSEETTPKLNYFFIHCRPNINMFANKVLYDGQLYGDFVHECFIERVLPTPVEVI